MDGFDAATYGERFADVYDDWYPQTVETDACVARLASLAAAPPTGCVLELAVGTGRLALPLADRGFDVRGIDASPSMLDQLAAKPGADTIAVAIADMATPVVPVRASDPHGAPPQAALVFVANNTLFALPGSQARRDAFAGIAALLHPDGRFVVEAFVPPEDPADPADPADPDDRAVTIRTLTADRVVLSAAVRDRAQRTITGQFIDFVADDRGVGSVRLRPYHLHYASPVELDGELAGAGFTLAERHADWSGAAFTADSASHVSVYRRT